jgi:2-polyprenyl-6-hydroxyphenyl methylase/3-demethylubiquinone-9 3-methyltransferase
VTPARLSSRLTPGGVAVISKPYHGYLNSVAIALAGGWDRHFTALWDCCQIKFWAEDTLAALLREKGPISEFMRVGHVPALAKSMIEIAHREEHHA